MSGERRLIASVEFVFEVAESITVPSKFIEQISFGGIQRSMFGYRLERDANGVECLSAECGLTAETFEIEINPSIKEVELRRWSATDVWTGKTLFDLVLDREPIVELRMRYVDGSIEEISPPYFCPVPACGDKDPGNVLQHAFVYTDGTLIIEIRADGKFSTLDRLEDERSNDMQ